MAKLYRAVPIAGFDAAKRYVRLPTPRTPMNIPYVVDNLWELLRPVDMPSRRHAAYASPTPDLALANASSASADRAQYLVCEVAIHGTVRVAQLGVTDARYHPDVKTVQQAALSSLGENFHLQSLAQRSAVAPLFLPGLSVELLRELASNVGSVQAVVDRVRRLSNFWASASPSVQDHCNGELFFELVNDSSYVLTPA